MKENYFCYNDAVCTNQVTFKDEVCDLCLEKEVDEDKWKELDNKFEEINNRINNIIKAQNTMVEYQTVIINYMNKLGIK